MREVVGVKNGHDEVNIQISRSSTHTARSLRSDRAKANPGRYVATELKPRSAAVKRPSTYTARSLSSDRAQAKPGRYVATEHAHGLVATNMTSRRSNSRDSDRVQTRTGSANAERIQFEDVSDALQKFFLSSPTGSEGRDLPPKKAKTNGSHHRLGVPGEAAVAKPFHWQFSHSKDCPITDDPDSVAHLVRHFKPAGCPLPFLRNMTEREAYAMEANNEFTATLEKCLQDVPRSGELYEIKTVVHELKLGLKMAQDWECA
ncbi:hypothetical protein F2Q69_00042113 [Brassica cretica]|uniref:Uncharacterized protein n=1 Tax=Brassica cretica TaxID=69181 RepID=A0A8S9NDE0_BRACR|nr:hypothetical protein F2Q69_00042113 [Brassica cretica]